MSIQAAALRVLYGAALALVPAALMRRDSVKYGMLATFAALVGCTFSGGVTVAVGAAVVLFLYQLYLRVAVRRLRWVVGTFLALGSYIAAQAVLLPGRLAAWESSFMVRAFVASLGVAAAMLIACVEMKLRRLSQTIGKDA